MTTNVSLTELTTVFADIQRQLLRHRDGKSVLTALTDIAAQRVPGADHAGITVGGRSERFVTVAATGDVVHRTDQIQYDLGTGPCVDAIVENTVFHAPDLRTEKRWPEFCETAAKTTGVLSMLSMRLYLEDDAEVVAGMNLYAGKPAAFDEEAQAIALLLATHGALAVANARSHEKASNLLVALKNSRTIGVAMGVLMNQHKMTEDQAFDALRIVSQHTHRKLADVAAGVAETGQLLPVSPSDSQL